MRPSLSTSGFTIASSAALFVIVGALLAAWPLVALGFVQISTLLLLYLLFLPHATIFHQKRVEFAWWVSAGDLPAGALTTGHTLRVQMLLRNSSSLTFHAAELIPLASSAVALHEGGTFRVRIPPQREIRFQMTIVPRAAGHWLLQGLVIRLNDRLGLFVIQAYFPNRLPLEVFPALTLRGPGLRTPPRGTIHDRAGARILRRQGLGSDLRELRDHAPGDPFRRIAWKATARTGKLMVREDESEVLVTQHLLVDTSPSMRGDAPFGKQKLDIALALCGTITRRSLDDGDRVGLITFDTRVIDRVEPANGPRQVYRILAPLLDLHRTVDEDLTDLTDGELCSAVADYLAYQEGKNVRLTVPPDASSPRWNDLAIGRGGDLVDLRATLDAIEDSYTHDKRRRRVRQRSRAILASDPRMAKLRTFCRLRGIELPYRRFSLLAQKSDGMAEALAAASLSRGSTSIVLISDLLDLDAPESVLRLLALAKRKRHHVVIIQPLGTDEDDLRSPHEQRLHAIATLRQERKRRDIRHAIATLRIPIFDVRGEDLHPSL